MFRPSKLELNLILTDSSVSAYDRAFSDPQRFDGLKMEKETNTSWYEDQRNINRASAEEQGTIYRIWAKVLIYCEKTRVMTFFNKLINTRTMIKVVNTCTCLEDIKTWLSDETQKTQHINTS